MKSLRILILSLFLIVVGCSPQPAPTATPQPTATPEPTAEVQATIRVLRVDSNHAEFPWSGEISKGVVAALRDNGYDVDKNVTYDEFYLDTKRNTSAEYFEKISAEAIAYIEETGPDIVIANDDNAARLVVQPMRDSGVIFVVLGVNGTPEAYELTESANVSGVLERPHMAEMMVWIEQVFGKDASISILAEDSTTSTSMFGDGAIAQTVQASEIELDGITLTSDFQEWQAFVKAAPETSDVLFLGAYATLRDENGEAIEPVAALNWTIENSEIPVMGFWEEAVHLGMLGGTVISGYTQGYEAAERAAKILDGEPVDEETRFSIPPRGKLIINRNAIERWSLEIPISLLEVSEIVGQ